MPLEVKIPKTISINVFGRLDVWFYSMEDFLHVSFHLKQSFFRTIFTQKYLIQVKTILLIYTQPILLNTLLIFSINRFLVVDSASPIKRKESNGEYLIGK